MSSVILRCFLVVASLTLTTCSEDGLSKWVFPKQTRAMPACSAIDNSTTVDVNTDTEVNATCQSSCLVNTTEICDYNISTLPCDDSGCKWCAKDGDLKRHIDEGIDICPWFCHTDCEKIGGVCRRECKDNEHIGKLNDTCPFPKYCNCCKPPGPTQRPPWNGSIQGDPQIHTFDGFHYMYNGHSDCEYVFFQECVPRPSFSVLIRYHYLQEAMKMVVTEVSIVFNGDRVTLIEDRLYINGEIHNILTPLILGKLTVTRDNAGYVRAKLDSTFTLTWNGKGRVVPVLDKSMFGKVCGMLGNADGDPSNDMKIPMPNGTLKLVTESDEFGDKWIVPGSCSI
ncbi:BMP-binding endothelial regulator protein-like [Saccoglossus kowalevskii]|uniref:BMP-binding endothelial regulator protein-like n=1 Tax=Saccoglossus kowalevskii TaxID=10224 RepID=A0ABM0MRN9_SACKO|nr:PREDICTED: BMP-binding endothelial regulator protein-like [Saccoglossus kowalevskii]